MSKDLGYEDNTAGPGKDSYNPKYKEGLSNYHRKNKADQGGDVEKSGKENAGDCLSNNNGTVNSDPS